MTDLIWFADDGTAFLSQPVSHRPPVAWPVQPGLDLRNLSQAIAQGSVSAHAQLGQAIGEFLARRDDHGR